MPPSNNVDFNKLSLTPKLSVPTPAAPPKVTTQQMASAVRTKYPGAYDSKTDAQIVNALVQKYPTYQSQLSDFQQPSFHNVVQNAEQLPGQLTEVAKGVTNSLGLNGAVDTIGTNMATIAHPKLMSDSGMALSPDDNLKRSIGAGLQIGGTEAALAVAPETIGGAAAAGAGVGASISGGEGLAEGDTVSDSVGRGVTGAAIGGVTGGAIQGLGKLLGITGDKIMTSVIRPTKSDIQDGFNLNTIKQYNLGGSLNTSLEKTQNLLNDFSTQLKNKLGESSTKIDLKNVFNDTAKELTDSSKLKGFGANTKVANTIDQLKGEVNLVNPEGGLSIPDAQVVKQAAGNFGAWQYGKPDPDSKASEIVYNTFYNKLKSAIEDSSPEGVKSINQQLSKLIPVQNAILRRLPVTERSNAISLNEMIGLVGSASNPAALGPTLLNMISRSGTAGNILSKFGPKIGGVAVPAAGITALNPDSEQQ